jgi:hypothetical protein
MKGFQIFQKILAKKLLGTQQLDIPLVKPKLPYVLDSLFQPRRNGKPTLIRHRTEKQVKIRILRIMTTLKITTRHSKFIKIAKHGQIYIPHQDLPKTLYTATRQGRRALQSEFRTRTVRAGARPLQSNSELYPLSSIPASHPKIRIPNSELKK